MCMLNRGLQQITLHSCLVFWAVPRRGVAESNTSWLACIFLSPRNTPEADSRATVQTGRNCRCGTRIFRTIPITNISRRAWPGIERPWRWEGARCCPEFPYVPQGSCDNFSVPREHRDSLNRSVPEGRTNHNEDPPSRHLVDRLDRLRFARHAHRSGGATGAQRWQDHYGSADR